MFLLEYEQHILECESIKNTTNSLQYYEYIVATRLRFFSSKPATRNITFAQSSFMPGAGQALVPNNSTNPGLGNTSRTPRMSIKA